MRHGNKNKHLGMTMEHRQAMFANMSNSLIEHKRITTTVQKAKALRKYFEPLVTRAKENTTHSRRVVFGHLQSKEAIKELYGPIAAAVGDRPGGYVRIIRTGYRHGDAADLAMIELVDFNPDYNGQSKAGEESKGTKRRTRRSGASKSAAGAATTAATAAVVAPAVAAVTEQFEEAEIVVNDVIEESNDAIVEAQTAAADEVSDIVEDVQDETDAPVKEEE
jgi:large subunit ribosomal protein L17